MLKRILLTLLVTGFFSIEIIRCFDNRRATKPPVASFDSKIYKTIRVKIDEPRSEVLIVHSNGKIIVQGHHTYHTQNIAILYKDQAPIKINFENGFFQYMDKKYRGDLELIKTADNKYYLVNILLTEDYLRGVIPAEMPATWPIEALKAQAICSRSYAFRKILYSKNKPFDVENTIKHQVYAGMSVETSTSDMAVHETSGRILVHDNKPVEALFHSNSGGYTERPEEVWGTKSEYFSSVPSIHDRDDDKFNWELTITESKIRKLLHLSHEISEINVHEYNETGSVRLIEVKTILGGVYIYKANQFRNFVGTTKLKSLKFDVVKKSANFIIRGTGFGHGVGMSQHGSLGLARENYTAEQILSYYFRNVELMTVEY